MKRAIILLVLAACTQLVAQDKSTITVKRSEVSKETVVVTAMQQGDQAKAIELNCNRDAGSCKAPEPGTYIMVRLPKNWGMYDCSNVDLYATTADPGKDQKLGEYCLVEK
jgi:hypothetical protein